MTPLENPIIYYNHKTKQEFIRVGTFEDKDLKVIAALPPEEFKEFYKSTLQEGRYRDITGSDNIFHFRIKKKRYSPEDFFKTRTTSFTLVVPRIPEATPHFLLLEDLPASEIIVPNIKYHLLFKDTPHQTEISQPDMNVLYETHMFKLKAVLPPGDPFCPNVYSDRFIREIIIEHNIRGNNIKYQGKQIKYETLLSKITNNIWNREFLYFLLDNEEEGKEMIRYVTKTESISAV